MINLKREYKKYRAAIYAHAVEVFNQVIRPYLWKHHLDFSTDGDGWAIQDKAGNAFFENDLPAYIIRALETPIPLLGSRDHYLYEVMPNYKSYNYRGNHD